MAPVLWSLASCYFLSDSPVLSFLTYWIMGGVAAEFSYVKQLDRQGFRVYIFSAMAKKKARKPVFGKLDLTRGNYILFFVGVGLLILGYILMAMGGTSSNMSLTVAPVILFIAFLVVIPLSIMYRKKSPESGDKT